jgi:hypothetical protein
MDQSELFLTDNPDAEARRAASCQLVYYMSQNWTNLEDQ